MDVRPIDADVGFGKSRPPCPACDADWPDALPLSYCGLGAVSGHVFCRQRHVQHQVIIYFRLNLCGKGREIE